MLKLIANKYVIVILTALISFAGILFLEWDITELLFFIFLSQLIKIPSVIYTNHLLNGEIAKQTFAFSLLYILVLSVYSLFFIILIVTFGKMPYDPSVMTPLNELFGNLLDYFGLPLLALILLEIADVFSKTKSIKPDTELSSLQLLRHILFYGSLVPVLIMIAVLKSKEFDLETEQISIITISVFTFTDLIRAKIGKLNFKETK
jgi:hypothetical protein